MKGGRVRILLTGCTGLIGSAVLRQLRNEHDVVTLGRRATSDVQADLTDPGSLARAEFGSVDALVHCAGVVDEDFLDDPSRAFLSATVGADALVRAAVAAGARQLTYISSAHVYGPMVGYKDEASPPDPRSDYAIAHYATEQIFKRQTSASVSGLALRPCAVFGGLPDPSGFRRWSLVPFSFPRDAARMGSIVIRSTGEQRRNFVGTEDIASTLARWLDSAPEGWSAINPLGGTTMSVFEFGQTCAKITEEMTGRTVEVTRQLPGGPTPGEDFEYASRSPIAMGDQDLRAFLAGLMGSIGTEA